MNTEEAWLPASGYEGFYEVSDLGRVRSLPRPTPAGVRGGVMLRQSVGRQRNSYLHVSLSREGAVKSWPVHRLVLEAFAGPCPPGQEARHGPGGALDNRLANLRWGTHRENAADMLRDGTHSRGERNGYVKLTPAAVADIRARAASGEAQRSIARSYHVTQVNVSMIVRRKTWDHVP